MTTFYASYPPNISGAGVPTYSTFSAFPSASSAGNGALAIALDTDTLYISNGTAWEVIGGPGVALSIGTFDSEGTPSANALTISANSLIAQSADATHPGMVNTSTQTFAGVKTFSSAPNLSSLTASLPLQLDSSNNVTAAAINLNSSEITGTLQPSHGGTGQTSVGNLTEATSSVLTITGGTGALISSASIQVKQSSGSVSGYLSSTDWTTFNNKQATITESNLTEATSSVLTITGGTSAVIGSGTSIQVKQSSGSQSGYLSSTDWTTFNNKGSGSVTSVALSVPATSILGVTGSPVTSSGTLGLTTTGTSGGVPYFSSTSALSSSAALTASQLVLGGGAGSAPTSLAAGSQYQVLTMGASNPGYGAVNLGQSAAVTGTLPGANVATATTSTAGVVTLKAVTVQSFTSAGSGTYTTPAGVIWIKVRLVGGGGGGSASGTGSPGAAGNGSASTFGTTLLSAGGGTAAVWNSTLGQGGTNSLGGVTGIQIAGSAGQPWGEFASVGTSASCGGSGGNAPFFGGGGSGGITGAASAAGVTNTGGGGGGAGGGLTANSVAGGGGGSGGYVEGIIYSPSSTYSYAVGAGGSAGTAGISGFNGAAGGSGYVTVEEHYY